MRWEGTHWHGTMDRECARKGLRKLPPLCELPFSSIGETRGTLQAVLRRLASLRLARSRRVQLGCLESLPLDALMCRPERALVNECNEMVLADGLGQRVDATERSACFPMSPCDFISSHISARVSSMPVGASALPGAAAQAAGPLPTWSSGDASDATC